MTARGVYQCQGVGGGVMEFRCIGAGARLLARIEVPLAALAAARTLDLVHDFLDALDPVDDAPSRPVLTCARGADRPTRGRPRARPTLRVVRGGHDRCPLDGDDAVRWSGRGDAVPTHEAAPTPGRPLRAPRRH
ncbi:MAG TPA: hypothetical protein VGD56_19175 [Gemmatirosa sp.]